MSQDETGSAGKARRGRPVKPEREKRTERKTVRFRADELATVEGKAERTGLDVSTYLREAGLGKKLATREKKKDRQETIRQLSRIGNNLNQLAHRANSGQPIDADRLADALDAFEDALSRV